MAFNPEDKVTLEELSPTLQTLSTLVSENPNLRNTLLYRDLLTKIDFVDFLCGKR